MEPPVRLFSPQGSADTDRGEGRDADVGNILKLEELESLRLKDVEGLEQEDCAARMEVSRPTFQRILLSARRKVADSLVTGRSIAIEGGHYTRHLCPVACLDCGKTWKESEETLRGDGVDPFRCPRCRSDQVACDRTRPGWTCRQANCRRGMDRDPDRPGGPGGGRGPGRGRRGRGPGGPGGPGGLGRPGGQPGSKQPETS